MFQVQKFPAADPNGQRDPDEHQVIVAAGQILAGNSGIAETPNFGTFEYSPLVRPADDFPELPVCTEPSYLAATQPWQAFRVSNTTGRPLLINNITKVMDSTAVAVANQFVTVFQRAAEPGRYPSRCSR